MPTVPDPDAVPGAPRYDRRDAAAVQRRAGERRLAAVVEGMSDAFLSLDAQWRVTYANGEACRLNGTTREALLGRDHWTTWPETVGTAVEGHYRRVAAERVPARFEHCYAARGVWHAIQAYPAEGGGVAVFYRDVTAERRTAAEREALLVVAQEAGAAAEQALAALRESEARFRHQALHDPLTGLANRALFGDRVAHALARAAREGTGVAVLYLDVDGFKGVNDALGHAAGDQCLVEAAARLRGAVRADDTVARLGGDEFAVLLEGTHAADAEAEAVAVAHRLAAALQAPLDLEGRSYRVAASVGIAATGGAAGAAGAVDSRDALLRRADGAMYAAKARGGGRHEVADRD